MAKSGIQGLAVGRSDIFKLDPRELAIEPGWNCRDFSDPDNIEHVQRLKESIRTKGVLEPLAVRMSDGDVIVTNGECRMRAVKELLAEGHEIKSVPVQTETRYAAEADLIESQITRNSGKAFTLLEQATVFARLLALGRTETQIGAAAGITAERVRQVVALSRATEPVKALVREGRVAATTVQRTLEREGDPARAEKALLAAEKAAKTEGREKIKPRDVTPKAPRRPNFQELLAEVISYADAEPQDDGSVLVVVPAATWDKVKDLRA